MKRFELLHPLLLVWHAILLKRTVAYIAYVELELLSFRVLDRDTIAEGSKCDDDHVNGAWNLCDFVFYVRNCSRVESTYECTTRIDRFYAPENTDFATFDYPRPATGVTIEGAPKEMVFNITVYDQDDGRSADDFVGNYLLRVTPDLIFRQDSRLVGMTEQVITIPRHSELKLRWRAYCGDTDCRIGVAGGAYPAGGAAQIPPQDFANAARQFPQQLQWNQLAGAAQQINPALFQPTQFQPAVQQFAGQSFPPQQFVGQNFPPQSVGGQFPTDFGGFQQQQRFSPVQIRSVPTEPIREAAERNEIRTVPQEIPAAGSTKVEPSRFVPFHWRSEDNANKAGSVAPVGVTETRGSVGPPAMRHEERDTALAGITAERDRAAPSTGSAVVSVEENRWPSSSTKSSENKDKSAEGEGEKKNSWANLQPERINALYKKKQEIRDK